MADFVKVALAADISPGQGKVVEVGDTRIAVFNVDGNFHAVQNTCLHQGGPLGEGSLDGAVVTCPWHGWRFDVSRGECLTVPETKLPRFEVKVEGDDLLVRSAPIRS